MNRNINANATGNYELFSRLVQEAKTKHLPIKRIQFNKYKHKKCKWIHNGRILKEPVAIANAFNRYFINIGPSLANQIHTHHNYKKYLRTPSKNQIALQPVEEYKFIKVIDRLINKSTKGSMASRTT